MNTCYSHHLLSILVMANDISIYYQNCRGIRTKLHSLLMNILTQTYNIIVLTETWLHEDITENEFIDNRYTVYRADRDRVATGRCDGGGVLIAIQRDLCDVVCAPTILLSNDPLPPVIDHLLIEFRISKRCYCIGAVYIPPKQNHQVYLNYLDMLQNKFVDGDTGITDFFIVGDFNLPSYDWMSRNPHNQGPSLYDTKQIHMYIDNFMAVTNSYQLNTFANRNNRVLDLFFTNKTSCALSLVSDALLPPDEHHPPFCVLFPGKEKNYNIIRKPYVKLCFGSANYDNIKKDLSDIDWNHLLLNKGAEEAVSSFYETLYTTIDKNVPKKNVKTSKYPYWFTPTLIKLSIKKNKAWITMKKYNTDSNYYLYSIYRKKFKALLEICHKKYINKVENSVKENIKYFWQYISHRRNTSDIPSNVQYQGSVASDTAESCDMFSAFFQSVFEPSSICEDFSVNDLNLNHVDTTDLVINDVVFTRLEVHKALKTLDVSKSAGIDNIPSLFFKEIAAEIEKPLCYLYNKCLSDGVFPKIWKSARVVPIHKDGAKNDVKNYRPISILPVLSKVFERLIHNALYPHLHGLILKEQHGFVKRRSTITNLISYTSNLFNALDKNKQIDSIYTDFRKAFDIVDHRILLEKIAFNGIRGSLWRWFKSYIFNRTQRVVIKGFESDVTIVTSGVPQGSILGPLLFVMFINDVYTCFKHSKFLLYADDLKIYRVIDKTEDHLLLQEDLDCFSIYCTNNKLQLSLNKCKKITFSKKRYLSKFDYSLNNNKIEEVDNIKDLGITYDSKLNFDIHIRNIIKKAYKLYGFVMRSTTEFKDPLTYIYLFKSLVRPQLEYGVSIWNPLYKKYNNSIEIVQRKYLRRVHFKHYKNHYSYASLLMKFQLLDLQSRRSQLDAMLLYDFCNNKYDSMDIINMIKYLVPSCPHMRSLRNKSLFSIPRYRTNAGIRSPLNRICNMYNKKFTTVDIFGCSAASYRRQIIKILLNTQN
jgi:hypothetical protein